ncbi:MAG: hypothetical protein AB1757_08010 [Acidobacteriota bacterium]
MRHSLYPVKIFHSLCRTPLKVFSVFVFFLMLSIAGSSMAQNPPKPAVDLQPLKANYQVKIETGGQTFPLSVTAEIKEENGAWVATEIARTPQGEVSDRAILEKGTLILTKRTVKQGPVEINVAFKDKKATGSMTMNGQTRAIDAETLGAMFADGAGTYFVVAALPLAEGYTTSFYNFDLSSSKTSLKQLKVVGAEKVTVPAGIFDAFKVEITTAGSESGKTTVWIAKDTRKQVKTVAQSSQGATITSELQP